MFASNSIWYPVVLFAAGWLGAVLTASSPDYGPQEAAYIIASAKAKLIVADYGSLGAIKSAIALQKNNSPALILLERHMESRSSMASVQGVVESGMAHDERRSAPMFDLAPGQSNKDVCAFLSFTSGTTSQPKGVVISHHNTIAQILQMESLTRPDLPRRVLLGVLPFFHITGLVQILQLPIQLGQQVVVLPKFDMKVMLETIIKYECDELWLVPPLLIRLVNDPIASRYDLGMVKQFNTGAAPLAKETVHKLAKRFPHIAMRQAWGMTETTSAVTLTPPALQTYDNAHTVGCVVPQTMVKIVNPESGAERSRNEPGEIWAKGPQVTMGYLNDPQATAETYDQEGYIHTGDIGRTLNNGLVLVEDRLKEMIKVKGVGVAPAELEDFLLGHPSVHDVAVIGVPDTYAGEIPKAFVVLTDNVSPDTDTMAQLVNYIRENKSRPKWLSGGVQFVSTIPKSASGKILRRTLRDAEETARKSHSLLSKI